MTSREGRKLWRKAIRKWQHKLLLGGYALTLVYEEREENSSPLAGGDWVSVASAESKPMYLQGRVKVAPSFLRDATPTEIDAKAGHEMTHILLGHMDDFMRALIEELPKAKQTGYWDWWHRVNEFTATHVARVAGVPNGS